MLSGNALWMLTCCGKLVSPTARTACNHFSLLLRWVMMQKKERLAAKKLELGLPSGKVESISLACRNLRSSCFYFISLCITEQQLIPIFHNYTMQAQVLSSYVFIAANIILHSEVGLSKVLMAVSMSECQM
uniref:Uncharacterized protein n=1 Tax=Ananas comosus var. bracteatus TaxID=296719 RepID=A0A6V7QZG0_ANACO